MFAVLKSNAQPGIVALELPAPGHFFAPVTFLALIGSALRNSSALPTADEEVERLQGLFGSRCSWRVGRGNGYR